MAVMPYFVDVMLPVLKKYNVGGTRLCTMSRQDVYLPRPGLERLAKKHGYRLHDLPAGKIADLEKAYPLVQSDKAIRNDQVFWRELGFESVVSIDASAFERATHILDLNLRCIPGDLQSSFDWVIDFGTMEHVFHVPNYLANIFDLVRPDGYVWHVHPCNNWVNHGFYQFSPTLLNDFYVQNGWEIQQRFLFQIDDHWANYIRQYSYDDESSFITPYSVQQLDDQFYFASILAKKIKGATGERIPQQFTYLHEQWTSDVKRRNPIESVVKIDRIVLANRWLRQVRMNPRLALDRLILRLKEAIKSGLLFVMTEDQFKKVKSNIRAILPK